MKHSHISLLTFKVPSILSTIFLQLKYNIFLKIGGCLFFLLIIIAVFAPFIAPYSVHRIDPNMILVPPVWNDTGSFDYLLGTDYLGRDVLSLLLYGIQLNIGLAVIIIVVAFICSLLLIPILIVFNGIILKTVKYIIDIFTIFPAVFIAIILSFIVGYGFLNVMLSIFLSLIPFFLIRFYNTLMAIFHSKYMNTIQLDGMNKRTFIYYIFLPQIFLNNSIDLLIAYIYIVGDMVTLHFLNLGDSSYVYEFGTMILQNKMYFNINPYPVLLPTVILFICFFSVFSIMHSVYLSLQEVCY